MPTIQTKFLPADTCYGMLNNKIAQFTVDYVFVSITDSTVVTNTISNEGSQYQRTDSELADTIDNLTVLLKETFGGR